MNNLYNVRRERDADRAAPKKDFFEPEMLSRFAETATALG
jgi:hypothetical protein